jgi:two-component system, chemotaxis family, protein-glutamate methylesterase/glutaminase
MSGSFFLEVRASVSRPHIIVIGASSGGVTALIDLIAALPKNLHAVIGIVLHVGNLHSILPELLTAKGELPAMHPKDGQPLLPGMVYVAPPNQHMLFTADAVRLSQGPRENYARPAIDPLFRTAALQWRERVIGVLLTGDLDDGTAGLAAIKECGGTVIVQDPDDAVEPSMPASALANVEVDRCLPLAQIASALVELVGSRPAPTARTQPERWLREQALFEGKDKMENLEAMGTPSALTCPDCGGGLWELKDTKPLRYRCHTGHGFSAGSLEGAQSEMAEHALWAGVRALHEREMLLRRLANVAQATGDTVQAEVGRKRADQVKEKAMQLSSLIHERPSGA